MSPCWKSFPDPSSSSAVQKSSPFLGLQLMVTSMLPSVICASDSSIVLTEISVTAASWARASEARESSSSGSFNIVESEVVEWCLKVRAYLAELRQENCKVIKIMTLIRVSSHARTLLFFHASKKCFGAFCSHSSLSQAKKYSVKVLYFLWSLSPA